MHEYVNAKCSKCKRDLSDIVDEKISNHIEEGILVVNSITVFCTDCYTDTTFNVSQHTYFEVTKKVKTKTIKV